MKHSHRAGVPRIGLALWCVAWVVICALLLMPLPVAAPEGSDLVAHFALFGAMALGALSFCHGPARLVGLALLTAAAGFALELAQGVLPYRTFALSDAAADLLGAGAGCVLALVLVRLVIRPAAPALRTRAASP